MKLEIISKKPKGVSRKVPILFIHGAWHGAWCWEKYFMPYFAEKGYSSYALSLRGHGDSDKPAHFSWMRIVDYVADVVQVVDQLPERPVMVGHSMGGMVVQKYLEENTVPAAVLLASVPVKGVLQTTLRIALRHPLAFLKANLTWSLYPLIGNPELTREAFFSMDIPDDKLNEYFSLIHDESYLAFLDMLLFKLPKPEKVSTDLLILGAENDIIFHPDEVKATAAAYGKKPEIFEGMAHDMMLEDEWQNVADRILKWLGEKGI
ncbi:MAG: alpha/beta hydrolase [Deltaproteobacteria bacterium]|nr:alpha/beta hydrolase [Deltaproteobacteria bacterium]